MPIAFCASVNALNQCIAQLPPALSCTTVVLEGGPVDLASVSQSAAIVLEVGSPSSPSYQALIDSAVSRLAKQGKFILFGPSIVTGMPLVLTEVTSSHGAQAIHHIGSLRGSQDAEALLQRHELRLLLLDGDVYAWYEPEKADLRIEGSGCAVVMQKNAAAGNKPAAVEINVLTSGMGQHW
jgi:hypothetical protein